jgi:hypothetical protein
MRRMMVKGRININMASLLILCAGLPAITHTVPLEAAFQGNCIKKNPR